LAATIGISSISNADPADDIERIVRAIYFEALPYDLVETLSNAQVARLNFLLSDPSEAAHYGNILLALGMSGHPDAFAVLQGPSNGGMTVKLGIKPDVQPGRGGRLLRHRVRAASGRRQGARGSATQVTQATQEEP